MASQAIAHLSFGGRRFLDHGLPLDSGVELNAFQDLVRETARWLYRLEHPDARRLPNLFDESVSLRSRAIEPGSAVLPLEPMAPGGGSPELVSGLSYLERSIALIAAAGAAANEVRPLPPQFPRSALSAVERFGASLQEDEWIGIQPAGGEHCRYTSTTRKRLLSHEHERYDDAVDVEGTVTAADVRRRVFTLAQSDDRPSVTVSYAPDQEGEILEALRLHDVQRIRVRGRGTFSGRGGLNRIGAADWIGAVTAESAGDSSTPIWETLLAMAAEVPPEESEKLPADLAEHPDKYLYGTRTGG